MLDNLRDQASFQEEEISELDAPQASKPIKRKRSFDQVTGMTAQQRFILAVMLLVIICLLGTMFLVIAGKIVPTFLF
jgi:hypothetical protein